MPIKNSLIGIGEREGGLPEEEEEEEREDARERSPVTSRTQ